MNGGAILASPHHTHREKNFASLFTRQARRGRRLPQKPSPPSQEQSHRSLSLRRPPHPTPTSPGKRIFTRHGTGAHYPSLGLSVFFLSLRQGTPHRAEKEIVLFYSCPRCAAPVYCRVDTALSYPISLLWVVCFSSSLSAFLHVCLKSGLPED